MFYDDNIIFITLDWTKVFSLRIESELNGRRSLIKYNDQESYTNIHVPYGFTRLYFRFSSDPLSFLKEYVQNVGVAQTYRRSRPISQYVFKYNILV